MAARAQVIFTRLTSCCWTQETLQQRDPGPQRLTIPWKGSSSSQLQQEGTTETCTQTQGLGLLQGKSTTLGKLLFCTQICCVSGRATQGDGNPTALVWGETDSNISIFIIISDTLVTYHPVHFYTRYKNIDRTIFSEKNKRSCSEW